MKKKRKRIINSKSEFVPRFELSEEKKRVDEITKEFKQWRSSRQDQK